MHKYFILTNLYKSQQHLIVVKKSGYFTDVCPIKVNANEAYQILH